MFNTVDWTIFLVYLAVVFGIGVSFARRQADNDEYFVGGRGMNWFAVGVSLFATAFSSLSFVALPKAGAYSNYHLLVTYLCIPFVITPLLAWLFVPIYFRLGVTSVYEYLQVRFNEAMRRLGSVLFALYAIGWMGSMVYATGLVLKAVLQLDDAQFTWTLVAVGLFATFYTAVGGIRAVIWTDVLQAATLGGGMVLVLVLAVHKIDGGMATIVHLGMEHDKFQMFDMSLDLTRAGRDRHHLRCRRGIPGTASGRVPDGHARATCQYGRGHDRDLGRGGKPDVRLDEDRRPRLVVWGIHFCSGVCRGRCGELLLPAAPARAIERIGMAMRVPRRKPCTANVGVFGVGHHAKSIEGIAQILGLESAVVA